MIYGGEEIVFTVPPQAPPSKKLIFPLDVLFEDEHLAVVRKPAGILVSGNGFMTIANALPQNIQNSSLPDACRPQPAHRLDYATTGVLLVGKTASSIRALNKLFEEKRIEKVYYAIAIGVMLEEGTIATDIDNKESKSFFSVVQAVASPRFTKLNLVRLTPFTGRRHQLRKHLSSIGHPILGDKDYGQEGLVLSGKGLYLHAYSISFMHPLTREKIQITADLPKRFKKIFPETNLD